MSNSAALTDPAKCRDTAMALFKKGYNCTQAVVCTFLDELSLDESTALRIASSFGGGMGRLREVCGAVSGMFMVAGMLYGYDDVTDPALKKEHYSLIQSLAARYKEQTGSIVCRELLGLDKNAAGGEPSERTPEFYKKRPCIDMIGLAAELTAQMINEHRAGQQHG